ncbi:MAG TPA: type II toxin-antitoxin system RelE/ParE family toxin [Caulobacteraceae bacterium]
MGEPLNEVAFTEGFLADAKDDGMTESEIAAMVELLSTNPEAGDLIVGSGGCRKVRVAGRGKGKSGGYRVVTFYARPQMPVYVIAALSKGSRSNFDKEEVAAMAAFAKRILGAKRRVG